MAVLPAEAFGSLVDTRGAARSDAFACRYVPAGGGHDVCCTRQVGALAVLENGGVRGMAPHDLRITRVMPACRARRCNA